MVGDRYGENMLKPTLLDSNERIARRCICCASEDLRRSPAILMPFVAQRAFGWEPVEVTDDWGLRDIRSGMAYALCNSVQCGRCGLVFLDIRFTEEEMSRLYAGYRGEDYTNLRDRYEPGYRERSFIIDLGATHIPEVENFLAHHVPARPKILDWGGDTGINTPFKYQAEAFHIFEISEKPTIAGAVRIGTSTIKNTDYDLIVLSHVLEHLPWPAKTLAEIGSIMRDSTVLYVETPYEDLVRLGSGAIDLHVKKRYWHEHINFFTPESLESLLKYCGMQVIEMRVIEVEGGGKHWHIFAIACKLKAEDNSNLQSNNFQNVVDKSMEMS